MKQKKLKNNLKMVSKRTLTTEKKKKNEIVLLSRFSFSDNRKWQNRERGDNGDIRSAEWSLLKQ